MELSKIREQSAKAAEQVCEAAKLKIGDLFVVGCSSSEILGEKIGTHSSVEVAEAVFEGIHSVLHEHGVELAAQCCEHLNRALIVERAVAEQFGLEEVNVVPQPKAGGSFGTTAYKRFDACTSSRWSYRCALRPRRSAKPFCCAHAAVRSL